MTKIMLGWGLTDLQVGGRMGGLEAHQDETLPFLPSSSARHVVA